MNKNEISISTSLGELCACVGGDRDYPEIYTFLRRKDGVEIDIGAVAVDEETMQTKLYVYTDTRSDSWQDYYVWSKEQMMIQED